MAIPPFHRNKVLADVESQLTHQPAAPSRNKKLLVNLIPPWEATSAIWELRTGEYRTFYDVDEKKREVYIRAVRRKPHGKTTEDII